MLFLVFVVMSLIFVLCVIILKVASEGGYKFNVLFVRFNTLFEKLI